MRPATASAQVLKPAPAEESSPREALRKKIFAKNIDQRFCSVLAKDPAANVITDTEVSRVVQSIMRAVNDRDDKTLRGFFHSRLKVTSGQVLSGLATIKTITGGDAKAVNYRVFALNSPDGSTDAIECEDTGVQIHPLYGHPLSAPVWLQITGRDEIVRLFLQLVPDKDRWSIGSWHVQQWTHGGKDFGMWFEDARAESAKSHKFTAWIFADIATKLLDGGGFLQFPLQKEAEDWKLRLMSTEVFQESIKNAFKDDDVRYVGTIFTKTGAGLLVRFGIKAEMSSVAIREHCKDHLKMGMALEWGKEIKGLRCAYIFPREDAKSDGVLGAILISRDDIK